MCSLIDLRSIVPSPVSNAQFAVPTHADDSNAASDRGVGHNVPYLADSREIKASTRARISSRIARTLSRG